MRLFIAFLTTLFVISSTMFAFAESGPAAGDRSDGAISGATGAGESRTVELGAGNEAGANGQSRTLIRTDEQAAAFLSRATFGGGIRNIRALNGADAANWLANEMSKPATLYLPEVLRQSRNGPIDNRLHANLFWNSTITARDQLRQRMVFALSQILVVGDQQFENAPKRMAFYMDVLSKNALGNYRDVLEGVTYSVAMAEYLTYFRNRKGDPATGRMPDENYAREILQLFSIGLVELNQDGSPRLNRRGRPIETYTNDDIVGLARVFTGLSVKGSGFRNGQGDPDGAYSRLQAFAHQHSRLEKTFLGMTIPANTGPTESIDRALDHIFAHPNVAPFISRQLIQRFTASNPSPQYVRRVARAFNTGLFVAPNGRRFGASERGDLTATLAAILLDQSVFPFNATQINTDGKVREPVLRFAQWARAFRVGNVRAQNERLLHNTASPVDRLGQQPFRSPSVFNFYRPGYVAPGGETGARNLTTPEFQLVNEGTTISFLNFMTFFVTDNTVVRDQSVNSFVPNYQDEIAMAGNPAVLVDHLDLLLTSGQMSELSKSRIIGVLREMQIRRDHIGADRRSRVHVAVLMTLATPAATVLY